MNNKKLFSMTSASGCGKTTLLNIIAKIPNYKTIELSGRPYLPEKGDYVTNKSDSINRRISYGSLVTFTENLLNEKEGNLFFSRCAVDRLAYGRALNVGEDLHDIIIKEIKEIVIPHIKVFYLPIEFSMPGDDDIRGTNEQARKDTDDHIRLILEEFNVPFITLKGSVEQRFKTIMDNL